jgi:hypothetical protein
MVHFAISVSPVPSSADKKVKTVEGELSSGLTKNELLDIVKSKHLAPVYASYDISGKYNRRLMFTPPYHCELQPIERGWSMVKNPIAYAPDLHETARNLKEKLEISLGSIDEEHLILVWKKCFQISKKYQDSYIKKCSAEESIEEIDDNKPQILHS